MPDQYRQGGGGDSLRVNSGQILTVLRYYFPGPAPILLF